MAQDFETHEPSDQDAKRARRAAKTLRDILRKTVAQSNDARQTTEDLLRAVLGEVKIPREYVNLILQQVNATRGELVRVIATEVRTFLDDANLGEELAKILTSLSFEIRTEIRFIPNDEALRPSVKSRVGVKSNRPSAKSAPKRSAAPPAPENLEEEEDDQEEFVETRGSAAIDRAIQSRIAALASTFLKGIVDIEDDGEEEEDEPTNETPTDTRKSSPFDGEDDAVEDDFSLDPEDRDDDESQRKSAFNPLNPRDYRMRVSLSPDILRRAEAAASQVATAGRVTASLSAATAASAVSAAATRAQAVVRGGRTLTSTDARDAMWKKWVSPEEPDLVGNPVIGAPADTMYARGTNAPPTDHNAPKPDAAEDPAEPEQPVAPETDSPHSAAAKPKTSPKKTAPEVQDDATSSASALKSATEKRTTTPTTTPGATTTVKKTAAKIAATKTGSPKQRPASSNTEAAQKTAVKQPSSTDSVAAHAQKKTAQSKAAQNKTAQNKTAQNKIKSSDTSAPHKEKSAQDAPASSAHAPQKGAPKPSASKPSAPNKSTPKPSAKSSHKPTNESSDNAAQNDEDAPSE